MGWIPRNLGFSHFRDLWKRSIYRTFEINTIHPNFGIISWNPTFKNIFLWFCEGFCVGEHPWKNACFTELKNKFSSRLKKIRLTAHWRTWEKINFQKLIFFHSTSTFRKIFGRKWSLSRNRLPNRTSVLDDGKCYII